MDAQAEKPAAVSAHQKVVELLRIEASAIECASAALSAEAVEAAVRILLDCTGKVIVLGVGKSGVIAQKIAQTMTSTGTAAVFVHPSDALHGGLGIVSNGDVAVAISNSGETDEIAALLPSLKARSVPLIAIVGNLDSTLARKAEAALDASVDREACPLDLAPTASTTVALAIGDALSMTVMEQKGLTAQDFAANHPAGRLGKRLTITVGDLMHMSPNVGPSAGWLEVVHSLSRFALGAVNIVDDDERLLGIVTDGDLRRMIERTDPVMFSGLTSAEMMTRSPVTVTAATMAYDALRLMEDRQRQIAVLPVVSDDGHAVGMLRLHDIVRSGI
jgi:arabinose-5-phosphate isomerase